jgi:hypothetical protein
VLLIIHSSDAPPPRIVEKLKKIKQIASGHTMLAAINTNNSEGAHALKDFSIKKTPAYVLIDSESKMLDKQEGEIDIKAMQRSIKRWTSAK